MKVLVTGGAGFIGSHTCLVLIEKGYDVIVIDSLVNSHKDSIERVIELLKPIKNTNNVNIQFVKLDIRDEKALSKLFLYHQTLNKPIQAVIHFAGLKSVKESILNPLRYWDVNVNGTINLLKVMESYKCRTIVFSSSATIYGPNSINPIKEDSVINPINPYGQTKAVAENILSDIYNSKPKLWRIANLRYFNPIGAHPSGVIGENPLGIPNNIFPYLCQVAIGKREKLKIFGNNWPTQDGTGVRDYIHVMDLADGHTNALEHLFSKDAQIINLNLGTGKGTSVLELINTFEMVNSCKINYDFTARRDGDGPASIANPSLAFKLINWKTKRDLKDMCKDGWEWQKRNIDGF